MVYGQLGIGKENNFCIFLFLFFIYFLSTFFSFISSHCLSVFFFVFFKIHVHFVVLLFVCHPIICHCLRSGCFLKI